MVGTELILLAVVGLVAVAGWVFKAYQKYTGERATPAGYAHEDKEPIGGASKSFWGGWQDQSQQLFSVSEDKGDQTLSAYLHEKRDDFASRFGKRQIVRHKAAAFNFAPRRYPSANFQELKPRDRYAEEVREREEQTGETKRRESIFSLEWLQQQLSGLGAKVFSRPIGGEDLRAQTQIDAKGRRSTDRQEPGHQTLIVKSPLSGYSTRAMRVPSYRATRAVEIEDSFLAEPAPFIMEGGNNTPLPFAPGSRHWSTGSPLIDERGRQDQETIEGDW